MREDKRFLLLHTNCMIVTGANRSCIYDLQRNKYYLCPNSLAGLFSEGRILDLQELYKSIDPEDKETLDEYICFLEEKEMVYYSDRIEELKLFPELSMEWDFPASISHLTIDVSDEYKHDFRYYFHNLIVQCNCRYVHIRFLNSVAFSDLKVLIEEINKSIIKNVGLYVNLKDWKKEKLIDWVEENKKIRSLVLHSEKNNELLHEGNYSLGRILTVQQEITDANQCGFIHPTYFSITVDNYTESQQYNTCLNRKLSIDSKGFIRNCPAMKQHFGHVKDVTINQLLETQGFKKLWTIKKDEITKCRDCELRHICTDCRAFTDNPEDPLSPPLKCGYNPYSGEWEEWSTNPLKQQAIKYYFQKQEG